MYREKVDFSLAERARECAMGPIVMLAMQCSNGSNHSVHREGGRENRRIERCSRAQANFLKI